MRFLLVDRIVRLAPGESAEGTKRIGDDEDYFRDHFPGHPIVPGVLLLESLAQLGGRLIEASVAAKGEPRVLPMLAKVDAARFTRPVGPGDELHLTVKLDGLSRHAARTSATARVAGQVVASAALFYALMDMEKAADTLTSDQIAALTAWTVGEWQRLWGGMP
jgi:3-hydroxyacyl-[acyl-carrier-protein] dehydratase